MDKVKICPVCGKSFIPKETGQRKYCSPECRKYANKHLTIERNEGPRVIRTFTCRQCNKTVLVRDTKDNRYKFCCSHCEKLYWKHSDKPKQSATKRTFICEECGKTVEVTSTLDRRRKFCSRDCALKYTQSKKREHRMLLLKEERKSV